MNPIFLVGAFNDWFDSPFGGCIVATSKDLRIRLARKVASGMARRQAALLFEVRSVWRKRPAWLFAHPEQIDKVVFIDEPGINTKKNGGPARALSTRPADGCRYSSRPLETMTLYRRIAL
jgi:hypothetical protein